MSYAFPVKRSSRFYDMVRICETDFFFWRKKAVRYGKADLGGGRFLYRFANDEAALTEARSIVEDKIRRCSDFGSSLSPMGAGSSDHELIAEMCRAAEAAGVGPMASVAGAVASYVMDGLIAQGCDYAVIDNGGDLAILSDDEVTVGLYTGRSSTSCFGLRIPHTDGVMGICSSSGVVGPSLSFGKSDISTVISGTRFSQMPARHAWETRSRHRGTWPPQPNRFAGSRGSQDASPRSEMPYAPAGTSPK